MDWFHPTLCFQGAACESCGWPHPRIGWKASSESKSDPRDHGGSLILGEKLVIFLGSKIFWMQKNGGQGCPCALVLLRREWFATLFLDIRALRRTDLFDGVAVKHHMINAVHVTEAQKHCLRMLTLLDKLINWESFMLFHHFSAFSTFFNRKWVYIGGFSLETMFVYWKSVGSLGPWAWPLEKTVALLQNRRWNRCSVEKIWFIESYV